MMKITKLFVTQWKSSWRNKLATFHSCLLLENFKKSVSYTDEKLLVKRIFILCNSLATITFHNKVNRKPKERNSDPGLAYLTRNSDPGLAYLISQGLSDLSFLTWEINGVLQSMMAECFLCAKRCVSKRRLLTGFCLQVNKIMAPCSYKAPNLVKWQTQHSNCYAGAKQKRLPRGQWGD